MSLLSIIGIILLVFGLVVFGFQGLSAFLGMGASNEFVYENIRFGDILDEGFVSWIGSISSPTIRGIAETLINAPLAVWMLGAALLCFLVHAFSGTKYIK
jgi:uncharacterized membrane protein